MIGNYRILRCVGSGGMGAVYEAVHIHLQRRCAIKLLHAEFAENVQATARFLREAQVANRPRSSGVVTVEDAGTTADGSIFLLMEFLDGETLSRRIAQVNGSCDDIAQSAAALSLSPLSPFAAPPPQHYVLSALRWARQIASTLEAVHKSGVIHRDLKPDNIFIISDPETFGGERVKIIDFGIAKVIANLTQQNEISWAPTLQRTANGTALGTPSYMAPEQWRAEGNITDRADVYAFGAILFEMFSGRPPYTAQVIGDLIDQHMNEPPPQLSEFAPWAPRPLDLLICQMLKKAPLDRPSMGTVVQQLEALFLGALQSAEPRLSASSASWLLAANNSDEMQTYPLLRAHPIRKTGELAKVAVKSGKISRRIVMAAAGACVGLLVTLIAFKPMKLQPAEASAPIAASDWLLTVQPENATIYQSSPQFEGDAREPLERLLTPVCKKSCRLRGTTEGPPEISIRSPGYRPISFRLDPNDRAPKIVLQRLRRGRSNS